MKQSKWPNGNLKTGHNPTQETPKQDRDEPDHTLYYREQQIKKVI